MEILEKTEIIHYTTPWYFWLLFILAVVAVVWVMCNYFDITSSTGFAVKIYASVVCIVLCYIGLQSLLTKEVPTGRYEYTVHVEDPNTTKDIYSQYEVIDINGNVWIIQDKEN